MDLVLHIGCEKTGTKSIQTWFDQNAPILPSRGIFYSKVLGRPNNRLIYLYGIEPGRPDEGLLPEGVQNAADHVALQERILRELTAEVQTARQRGCTTFIISNEHLQSRCMKDENVARIHSLLAPLFDKITVYCFVRPQVDVCLSLTSTMSRLGLEVSRQWMTDLLSTAILYFDMAQLMQRWAKAFGRDHVIPVPFKRNPDVITYFEKELNLLDPKLPRPPPANEALDWRVIAMCNATRMRAFEGNESNTHRRFFINEMPVEEKLTIDRATAQALQARYDDSNRLLCAEWPQIEFADMTPNWSRYPEVGNIDKLAVLDEFGPFLRFMIERFNSESWFNQARVSAAASERDALTEKFDSAIQFAEKAIEAARRAAKHEYYEKRCERMIENLEMRMARMRRRMERQKVHTEPAAAVQD
jgi:hypothetical protein